MAKVISTSEAARNLGDVLARIKHTGETFILHKNDKPSGYTRSCARDARNHVW